MNVNLIIRPTTCDSDVKALPRKRVNREHVPRNSPNVDHLNRVEDRYILKLLLWYFVLTILPAILTLLYLVLNPDALMIDISPKIDFSAWQPGQMR